VQAVLATLGALEFAAARPSHGVMPFADGRATSWSYTAL
jgi:hypothetical protein